MKSQCTTARREFLATGALALPAAVVGAAVLRGGTATSGERESDQAAGYRETPHILAYYRTVGL